MKKLLLFTILILAATVFVVYNLNVMDSIVHGTLYNYGLQFSYDWATPYWTLLRITQALVTLMAISTLVSVFYVYRKYIRVHVKPEVKRIEVKGEKRIIPSVSTVPSVSSAPSLALQPEPRASSPSGLVKCAHCNRVFAQPLRMLDFHSDRPRIVNICPFCNEVIPPVLRQEEPDQNHGKKGFQKGKRNHDNPDESAAKGVRELQEMRQAQRREEARKSEEKVSA